jgi:hypothetical protein
MDPNIYGYVYNDPINVIDPFGLDWESRYLKWLDDGAPDRMELYALQTFLLALTEKEFEDGSVDCLTDDEMDALYLKAKEHYDAMAFGASFVPAARLFGLKRIAIKSVINPNPAQQLNISRFVKKIPANSRNNVETFRLPNNGLGVKATSPGKVPGSKAVYEKHIDVSGKTIKYTKTTYDPLGNIVHVKDKITGLTIIP